MLFPEKQQIPDPKCYYIKGRLQLITEIESFTAENQKQQEQIEELETIIKELKQDYKDHIKFLGDKLNDQIEYSKQDKKKIEELEKELRDKKIKIEHLVEDIGQMKETIVEYYGTNVEEKIKQLQAVCDAAEEYRQAKEKLICNKTNENMENASIKYTKLMQALAEVDNEKVS